MKTTLIGKATRLGEKDLLFVKDENGWVYFCHDVEALCNADRRHQNEQKVKRFISNTAFTERGKAIEFMFYGKNKETKTELQRLFLQDQAEDKLSAIVSLAEGADSSDIERFADIIEVREYRELKEMGSSLSAGLGFPGKGFGLIICTENHFHFGRRTKIFLEIVHSYMEGYSVEHQELTPELFVLMNLNIITKEDFR